MSPRKKRKQPTPDHDQGTVTQRRPNIDFALLAKQILEQQKDWTCKPRGGNLAYHRCYRPRVHHWATEPRVEFKHKLQ